MKKLWILLFASVLLFGEKLSLSTQEEEFLFEVDMSASLEEIVDQASFYVGEEESVLVEISSRKGKILDSHQMRTQGGDLGYPRQYQLPLPKSEADDIRFIVNTLANKTLVSIALLKSELEEVGERIQHVHPLNFLEVIFTDEELKVGIRNIRGKGWVWQNFTAGLKESLTVEAQNGNLEGSLEPFCHNVGVAVTKVRPFVKSRNWDGFLDFLIKEVPRNKDGNRYDF